MVTQHLPALRWPPHAVAIWARRGARHLARPLCGLRHVLGAVAIAIVESPTGGPRASLISLTLGLVVAVVALRAVAGTDDAPTRAPGATATAPRPTGQSPRTVAPSQSVARGRVPMTFAGPRDAARALDRMVWAPAVLPEGATLAAVAWRPDVVLPREPGAAPAGVLRTTYAGPDGGPVLYLSQGPGVGVSRLAAPEGMWGTVPTANGEITWVRGHAWQTDETSDWAAMDSWGCGCGWTGSELRAGVAPVGPWGWRLESEWLSLDELLAVAESMSPIIPAPPTRILWLAASQEQAGELRHFLATAEREGMGAQGYEPVPEVIVVGPDDAGWFWNWLAAEATTYGGSHDVIVNDLRPPAGDTGPSGGAPDWKQ